MRCWLPGRQAMLPSSTGSISAAGPIRLRSSQEFVASSCVSINWSVVASGVAVADMYRII